MHFLEFIQKLLLPQQQLDRLIKRNLYISHPPGYGGVPQGLSHQVSKQGVGLQEAQSDVGGFGEIPQERGIGEVHGSRASIYQRNYNLQDRREEASELGMASKDKPFSIAVDQFNSYAPEDHTS